MVVLNIPSIRSALYLDTPNKRSNHNPNSLVTVSSSSSGGGIGEVKDVFGNFIDMLDLCAVNIGSYLRNDAIARGCFILYFIILHLWAFCLVVFHAHGSLEPSADIGPAELLKHTYRQREQMYHNEGMH